MPWPPKPSNLEPKKFKIASKLNEFLTCLLTIKGENEIEVINILSPLRHGALCLILSKRHAENAFIIQKQQSNEVILPINTAREAFTIYVADNIDRNEETLTG